MPRRRQKGEGSVYHRGTRDQWVAVADLGWRNGRRDRREFTGPSPDAAMEKRARFLDSRRDGFTLPRGRQPTVAEWVLHWVHTTARAQVDPNTWYRSYRQKATDYIAPYFTRVPLAELSAEDVEDWHAALLGRPSRRGGTISASTVVTAHRIFSSCLKEAVRRRRISFNPCSVVPPPQARRIEIEPPTADEVQIILAACRERPNGARWVLAISSGLRQGEALALRWRDVRLTSPASVTVRRSAARIAGETVMKDPKSEKSRRAVPLPAVAVTALKAHREAQGIRELHGDGLVFAGRKGQPVDSRADWQDWTDLLAELGLPHYRPHLVRHGFATMLLEAGADPRLVQDLMGHSTTALLQVYQHIRPAAHAQAVSMLDQVLGGGQT